jgi:hypothetical protein
VDDSANGAFEVDEQQVSLAPYSTISVELRVTPLQAGALHIQAFTWQVSIRRNQSTFHAWNLKNPFLAVIRLGSWRAHYQSPWPSFDCHCRATR